ncbi:uncharacterized protein LOC132547321 [Ylistrum balloti]|uniref:uncharacterized protein LOC132547321 n=1 Tax=Ylistrum balloti TaxID=509963 RepID=UPI002905F3FD|nr:uncharacterized protein LOC132547321 [Ylistrum balloti]
MTSWAKEPDDCYRDTTRTLCDWFFDRPSTSSQAQHYAATSPQPMLYSVRRNQTLGETTTPNNLYRHSDQFWNDRFKQLKTGSSQSNKTTTYFKPTDGVNRHGLLSGSWCRGRTTPFRASMGNLYTASRAAENIPSDDGSCVDPCHTLQYGTDGNTGSSVDPQPLWSSADYFRDLD